MNKSRHVVVIGAGIGGLAAAIDLAASGYAVTVLERGPEPGGKMRELVANGSFDDHPPMNRGRHGVFEELPGWTTSNDSVIVATASRAQPLFARSEP